MKSTKKFFGLLLLLVVAILFYNTQNVYGCTPPEGWSMDPVIRYHSADIVFVGTIKDIYTQDMMHLLWLGDNWILTGSTKSQDIAIKTSYNSSMCGYDIGTIKKGSIRLMYGLKSDDGTYLVENNYPNRQFNSMEDARDYISRTFPQDMIQSGVDTNNNKECADIYHPVCGEIAVACFKAPCFPEFQSFANICEAEKHGATNITDGTCVMDDDITNTGLNTPDDVTILDEIKRAHNQGITSFDTIEGFMPDDFISRQQASKMLVNFAKNLLDEQSFITVKNSDCRFVDESLFHYSLVGYIKKACEQNIFVGAYNNANGSYFYPYDTLTRGQAITTIMRVLYGKLDENLTPRYKNYLDKIKIVTPDTDWDIDFEKRITRGEMVDWMYEVSKHYHIDRY